MQFGMATVCLLHCEGDVTMRMYAVLSECGTVLWGLSAEWHSYKLAEVPNKHRNSMSVLQAQTRQIAPKHTSIEFCFANTNQLLAAI
jgi:hypothetical protein